MQEISKHKNMELNQQSEICFKDYTIELLETIDEIHRVLCTFDNLLKPALSKKVSDLYIYAGKLKLNAIVYVAKKIEFLGIIAFYANDNNTRIAYLTQIAVQPNAQGRKIGKHLLDICIEVSKSKGMKEMRLEVHNQNYIAMRFYQKNGFEFLGEASTGTRYMRRNL